MFERSTKREFNGAIQFTYDTIKKKSKFHVNALRKEHGEHKNITYFNYIER